MRRSPDHGNGLPGSVKRGGIFEFMSNKQLWRSYAFRRPGRVIAMTDTKRDSVFLPCNNHKHL